MAGKQTRNLVKRKCVFVSGRLEGGGQIGKWHRRCKGMAYPGWHTRAGMLMCAQAHPSAASIRALRKTDAKWLRRSSDRRRRKLPGRKIVRLARRRVPIRPAAHESVAHDS